MNPHTLRLAAIDDAETLVDLHLACWREAYAGLLSEETIEAVFADRVAAVAHRRERLSVTDRPTWVAETAGERGAEMVGFATAGPARHPDPPTPLELYALYARAAWWGTGVGRSLLTASVGGVAAYLWVLDGNDRAIGFYRRHGFDLDGATEAHPEGRHLRMVRADQGRAD